MKTPIRKTLALAAAFLGLQLFTATPAWAAETVTGAKWGNIVTESGKGFYTKVDAGNGYNSFTLNLSKSDNLSKNDISGPGTIKITGIRILSRYETTDQTCPTVTLTQGTTTATSSSGTKTTGVVIYNSTGGSYTRTAFDVTFDSTVTFDTATAITMAFDAGKSLTVVQPMSLGATCASANYSPVIEITGDYTPLDITEHTATASGTCSWTTLAWDPAWPTGGGALHNANMTIGSAATALTIDANETMPTLKVTSEAANDLMLAKANGVTATVTTYDFSGAHGKVTVGYDTGAAAITAGDDTVLNGTGTGLITMAANQKATIGNQHFGSGSIDLGNGSAVVGPNTSTLVFNLGDDNTQTISGSSTDADNRKFGVKVASGTLAFDYNGGASTVFKNRTVTADGVSAVIKFVKGDATGYSNGGTKIVLANGGTLAVGKRDTCKTPFELCGGHMRLLKDCYSGNGQCGFDLFGNPSTWTVKAASGATAQNPTVSSIDCASDAGEKDRKVNIRSGAWNVTVDEMAQFDVNATIIAYGDGQTPGKLVKKGAGKMVLKAAGTYDKGTDVQAGTLKVEATSALGTGAVSVSNGAKIELNAPENASYTLANAISGAGRVEKLGAGTFALTGTLSYTGTTTVSAGTLNVPAGQLSGDVSIEDGATLNITGASGQAAYLITSGTFAKGTGTLLLNGSDYAAQGYQLLGNKIINRKTATVDGSKTWAELWGENPPAATDAVVLTVTANATLTIDSSVTIAGFIVTSESGNKLTLANGGNLTVTDGYDFSGALGTVDLGLDGIEDLAKNAVFGVPYSYWLFPGKTLLGADNIALPTMPNWYSVTKQTVSGFGTRFVVTAPAQAQFGAISVNMKKGQTLGSGNHGVFPVDVSSWNELTASKLTDTFQGATFTLSGKTGTFWAQGGCGDDILNDYVDDANGQSITLTVTSVPFAKYRVIAYFNADTDGSPFVPVVINNVSYAGENATGTASTTVKGSTANWGLNTNRGTLAEGINCVVSDVITESTVTITVTSKRSTARGTPAAYQIVKVGSYYAGVEPHFIAPSSDWDDRTLPTASLPAAVTTSPIAYGGNAAYLQTLGEKTATVVDVTSSIDAAHIYGLYAANGGDGGGAITRDVYLKVDAGNVHLVSGGEDAKYNTGSKTIPTGNLLTQIGGTTLVDYIFGAGRGGGKDGVLAEVKGDVGVTIEGSAQVRGSAAAGWSSAHQGAPKVSGNTSMLVKNIQNSSTPVSGQNNTPNGWLIGGSIFETNGGGGLITGNTSVTVDLASDAAGTFSKSIVGGSLKTNSNDSNAAMTVEGSSSVVVNAPAAVTFSGKIIGGGHSTGGKIASVGGNASVALNGGTYTGDIYAGGYNANDTVTGTATLTLGGGTFSGNLYAGTATGTKTLNVTDDIVIKANNQTLSGFDAFTIADGKTVSLDAATDGGLVFALPGNCTLSKTGAGKLTLSGFVEGQAHAFIANAGTLTATGDTFGNSFGAGANGTVAFEWDVSAGGTIAHYPTIATSTGTVRFRLTLSKEQIKGQTEFTIATLPAGMTADDVTIALLNADTGNEVPYAAQMDGQLLKVRANVVVKTHEFTPTASGDITWQAGQPLVSGGENFSDYDNAVFRTTEFTTDVTVGGTKIEAGKVLVGGTYNFTGATPLIADALCTEAGADATFANDVVATDVAITNGTVRFASLTANGVVVSNATLDAKVLGPSMKYVRLTITATSGNQQPAVGEFRLYRGSATTGYTIVDWPQGTKISDSTPDTATKTSSDYPSEVGTKNEKQPGTLIDGYYGPDKTDTSLYADWQDPYATHDRNHNKWWPTSQSTGPWVVTIEFPYPVATFSGCNFCLADHEPRNPTAWTIEVSNDGQAWTEVANKSGATWSGQHAWCVGADKPEATLAENWPAFLNTGTTPTVVNVKNDATVVADGNWTAALNVSGKITFLGVEGKNLTLDAASTSSFAAGAKLKFDLNDYDVSAAGKQYVVAGPTEGWPEVKDITVEPSTFSLYKDAKGYYVVVESGNYWMGEDDTGVGTWNFRDTRAWGTNVTSEARFQWLNGVPAFFTHDGTVTIADDQVQPTAINVTSNNGIAVTFTGDLSMFATLPINVGSTNVTITLDNNEALTPSVSVVDGAVPNFVKTGTGGMTIASGNDFKQGTLTVRNGTLTVGNAPAINTFATVTAEGTGVIDINGKGADAGRTYTLGAGGSLVNNGGEIGVGSMQMAALVVNGNATVGGTGNFGLIASQWGETALTLGENTLVKTGENTFWLCHTTVTGNGMIDLQQGKIDTNSGTTAIPGTLKIGEGTEFLAKGTVSVGAIVGAGGTLNTTGTIDDFGLSGTLSLAGNGTYDTITMDEGAVANVGNRRDLTFAGAGTVDVKLTTQEEQTTTEITAFNRAGDGTTAVGKVYDSTGADVTSHVTKNGNKFTINHEAKAGTIFYFTLKQAIGEAAEGAVITMLANASVGDTAVTLNNSATLVGENYAITGAGITAAPGKVLTIASGFIYLTDLGGTYALVGGKYPETSKAKWSAAQGYHYAQVDTDQATLYQIVKNGDTPAPEDEKAYIVTGGTIAASKSDLVSKGYITQEQDVETFLNDNGANSIPNWQNVALGLSSTDATAKPFPAPVQGTSTTQVSLKLGNNVVVDKGSGATVTYKVMTGDGSSWTALPTEYAYGATATVDLPDDGVKYYKLDVIVTPAM